MKTCIKCKKLKKQEDFYGKQGDCKECTKKRVRERENFLKLTPEWIISERKRHREKYYRLKYKNIHKPDHQHKKEAVRKYKLKYPEKTKAKSSASNIKIQKGLERHHWSYREEHYKDILCLSNKDHNKLHRYMYYDQSLFMYRCDINTKTFNKGDMLDTKEKHITFYLETNSLD